MVSNEKVMQKRGEVVPLNVHKSLRDNNKAIEIPLGSVRLGDTRSVRKLYRRLINESLKGNLSVADLARWGFVLKTYISFLGQEDDEALGAEIQQGFRERLRLREINNGTSLDR